VLEAAAQFRLRQKAARIRHKIENRGRDEAKTVANQQGLLQIVSATDGKYYDPWGTPYLVAIDGSYDNQLLNPYTNNAGATPNLYIGVIAWSLGADGSGATGFASGDKSTGVYADDVISWQ
jgi:hypothetical protein